MEHFANRCTVHAAVAENFGNAENKTKISQRSIKATQILRENVRPMNVYFG
jgi:hypothetical protein